ncbi:MAG: hypothetical protein WDA27_11300 [Actinomycetota bacterium]
MDDSADDEPGSAAFFIAIDVGYHRGAVIRILYAAYIVLCAWYFPRVVKRFGTHLTLRSRVLFVAFGGGLSG